jgi:hypothetical protein
VPKVAASHSHITAKIIGEPQQNKTKAKHESVAACVAGT